MEQVFTKTKIDELIQLCFPSNHPTKILLVLQEGRMLILSEDCENKSDNVLLDWIERDLIEKNFEEGLLGLALHPLFQENRLLYAYHTMQNPKRTVVTDLLMLDDAKELIWDQSYEREIISISQPFWNHNSGIPCFGPDGYLYLSTSGEGKANDPKRFSQNTFSLLSKILRIDADSKDSSFEYKIPPGNPFIKVPGFRVEICAVGLRNLWRLSWDYLSGNFLRADVGQHKLEEWCTKVKSTEYLKGSIFWRLGNRNVLGALYGRRIGHDATILVKRKHDTYYPSPGQTLGRRIAPFKPVNFHDVLDGEIYALGRKGQIYLIFNKS